MDASSGIDYFCCLCLSATVGQRAFDGLVGKCGFGSAVSIGPSLPPLGVLVAAMWSASSKLCYLRTGTFVLFVTLLVQLSLPLPFFLNSPLALTNYSTASRTATAPIPQSSFTEIAVALTFSYSYSEFATILLASCPHPMTCSLCTICPPSDSPYSSSPETTLLFSIPISGRSYRKAEVSTERCAWAWGVNASPSLHVRLSLSKQEPRMVFACRPHLPLQTLLRVLQYRAILGGL